MEMIVWLIFTFVINSWAEDVIPAEDQWHPVYPTPLLINQRYDVQEQTPAILGTNVRNRFIHPIHPIRPYVPQNQNKYYYPHNKYQYPKAQPYNQQNYKKNIYKPYSKIESNLHGHYYNPVFQQIRHDVDANAKRLKEKEELKQLHNVDRKPKTADEEGEENVHRNEQNENFTPKYEPYNVQYAPNYYQPPPNPIDFKKVQNKLKYPGPNLENIKVHPRLYFPLKSKINNFKQDQWKTFSEGQNEYPEIKPVHEREETPDGYDIYQKQKHAFDHKNGNFHSDFDRFVGDHHPKAAPLKEKYGPAYPDEKAAEEFIPVKMYAQVRHSESVKHLPRKAALEDAESSDEVINAPRLKQAIKVTKAQTVYSEEGYEDSAYDHAGHLKHASNHEGHRGFSKDNEKSRGKYKSGAGDAYEDGGRSLKGKNVSKGKKWLLNDGTEEEFDNHESFAAKEGEHESNSESRDLDRAGSEKNKIKKPLQKIRARVNKLVMTGDSEQMVNNASGKNEELKNEHDKPKYVRLRPNYYWKRNKTIATNKTKDNNSQKVDLKTLLREKLPYNHKRSKRESDDYKKVPVPSIDYEETLFKDEEIVNISKEKLVQPQIKKKSRYNNKYPYYRVLKNSPLKYAENLRNIPKKTNGGMGFYDSTASIMCEEVEGGVDPVPERIKNKTPEDEETENDDDESQGGENKRQKRHIKVGLKKPREKRETNEQSKKQPRLKGLGDKIDCFKEKYFGADPLDSPFFNEDEIAVPEPLKLPRLHKNDASADLIPFGSVNNQIYVLKNPSSKTENPEPTTPIPPTFDDKTNEPPHLLTGEIIRNRNKIPVPNVVFEKYATSRDPQMRLYADVMGNIKSNLNPDEELIKSEMNIQKSPKLSPTSSVLYKVFKNQSQVNSPSNQIRITRDNHFVYEPYKIIQQQQIKKTPLSSLRPTLKKPRRINLLTQASSTIETIVDLNGQPVKRDVKAYTNIGKDDRRVTRESSDETEEDEDEEEDYVEVDPRRGEPKYEINQHKNHKHFHSPVTFKTSIRPEELNVEYLLKSNEEKDHASSEMRRLDDEEAERVLIDDIANKVASNNVTNQDVIHRFKNYRPTSKTVFDVTAYLPRPIVINNILPRHNYSSRYTNFDSESEEEPVTEEAITSTEATTDKIAEEPTTEVYIPRKRLRINTTQKPVERFSHATEINIAIPKTRVVNKRRRIKLIKMTTPLPDTIETTEYSSNDEEYAQVRPTTEIVPIVVTDEVRQGYNQNDAINYWKRVLDQQSTTERIVEEPRTKPTRRTIRPLTPRTIDMEQEVVSRKPRILEKTSKKRKTTVITNSKRYDSPVTTSASNERKARNNIRRRPKNNIDSSAKKISNNEKVIVQNNNRKPLNYNKDNVEVIEAVDNGEKSAKIRQGPIEESRFEEEMEEEEVIKERPTYDSKPFAYYQDPNLAKNVNKLSEGQRDDQHTLHTDVEVFNSEFEMDRGPKHGGNYKKIPGGGKNIKKYERLGELEDLNENSELKEGPLHGGNYRKVREDSEGVEDGGLSARVLNSFVSLVPVTTQRPVFEKNPGKRLYYFVKDDE